MYRVELPNGQVRYRGVSDFGTVGAWVCQEKVAEGIRAKINEYLSSHPEISDRWTLRSCQNPVDDDLTAFLKDAKLIGEKDRVYVSGSADMAEPKERGFQIGIISPSNKSWLSREDAWFIWNAQGYDPTAENSGFIRLKKSRLDTSFF